MKELLIISVLTLIANLAFNQEADILRSKSGQAILPEKGDISFSIDAVPFLNILNSKGENPGFNFSSYFPAIYIKIMTSSKTSLMFSPVVSIQYESKRWPWANGVSDIEYNYQEFGGRIGFEKRYGKNRLQVPIGGELGGGFIMDENLGEGIKETITGFLGVEYFPLPKISIGGKFGLGASYINTQNADDIGHYRYENLSIGYNNFEGNILLSFYF